MKMRSTGRVSATTILFKFNFSFSLGFMFMFMLIFVIVNSAVAAIAPLQVKPGRLVPAIRGGALAGGRAAEEFSLLGLRRVAGRAGMERFIISYGDRNGKPLKGEPGFFQIALDRSAKRLVIDLAQVSRTAIDSKDLARVLSSSRFVAGSDMTMDPLDGSTNITIHTKIPIALAVMSEVSDQGRIILELREDGAMGPALGPEVGAERGVR